MAASQGADGPSLEDILSRHGLQRKDLERQCPPDIRNTIAAKLDDWKVTGYYLELPKEELTAILRDNQSEGERRIALLECWQERQESNASLLKLADVLHRQGRRNIVRQLCELLSEKGNTLNDGKQLHKFQGCASESDELSNLTVESTEQGRIQADSGDTGAGVNVPKPKYGEKKLNEIQATKEPSEKLKEGEDHYESVKQFAQDAELLIQTVNDNETWAVLGYMEGPKFSADQQLSTRAPVTFGRSNVRLGMFSHYKAALVQTGMGAKCDKKLSHALKELPNVKGIIALGIAWGCKGKCELGDVLVATQIVGWDQEKWTDGTLTARDRFYVDLSEKFQEVFADLPGRWKNFERAEKMKSIAQKALLISTAKLINDEEIRRQVVAQEREASGGEMEGHVLVQKIQKEKPELHVAVIKGVSDFADGNKHDEWQLTAAMAAVDYAKYMLDKTNPKKMFD